MSLFKMPRFPDLLFLACLEKGKENHQKKQGFLLSAEALKFLGKKGKTLNKNKEFLAKEKQGIGDGKTWAIAKRIFQINASKAQIQN